MGDNGACVVKSAQDLLVEFQQTGSQQPFEEIARRYAGMVYNVALRVTRDAHDAEDATQATFLTLAVHAKTTGKIRYIGPWLKKVSHRLALDIRRSKKRRTAREQRHAQGNGSTNGNGNGHEPPASDGMQIDELRHILREEIDKLPAKYRLPLILYYFGGLSPEEMSKELQVNTSTLGVRLHRGRKMLGDNLTSRGISMNAAIVGGVLGGMVDNFVRDNLVHACAQAAAHVGSGGFVANGAVSAHVTSLMQVATAALRWSRLKTAVAAFVLCASTFAGATEVLHRFDIVSLSTLRQLNPLRIIRPLLDRMINGANLRVQAPSDPTISNTAGVTAPTVPAGSSGPDFSIAYQWPASPLQLHGADPLSVQFSSATGSVESVRALMSLTPARDVVAPSPVSVSPRFQLAPIAAVQSGNASRTSPAVSFSTQSASNFAQVAAVSTAGGADLVVDRGLGASAGQNGDFRFNSGQLSVGRFVVGRSGFGSAVQTGGTIKADHAVLGELDGSTGVYEMSAGTLLASSITVGDAGHGTLRQRSGAIKAGGAAPGTLTLGSQPGSSGLFEFDGGTVDADTFVVGDLGTGTVVQNSGTTTISVAAIGRGLTGQGQWLVNNDGVIQTQTPSDPIIVKNYLDYQLVSTSPAPPPTAVLSVGHAGSGTLVLNSSDDSGVIQELPGTYGSSLLISATADGNGAVVGYGTVAVTGTAVINGKLIASGNGADRALDLSSASRITNTIDNPSVDGFNGLYARDGGRLKLPPIKVTGQYYYNWGEELRDDSIDLVNSVRFRPWVRTASGSVDIELIDPLTTDVPALPGGRSRIGLWSLTSSVDIAGLDLMVRYDDDLASQLQLDESTLALWVFDGTWQIAGDLAGLDVNENLLWSTTEGLPSYFAAAPAGAVIPVSGFNPPSVGLVPEPSSIACVLATAGCLLLRRRRA